MADTRTRLTERGYNPKTGSFGKSADPYLMNQERRPGSEPSVTHYENGNPSSWAEDVQPVDTWKQEYEKGRNEVGLGNFLDSTWKDREQIPPSYDKAAADEALKQASADRQAAFEGARKLAHKALHLAHAMFPEGDEGFIQNQARDFMNMGPGSLDATIARIVGAGEVPDAFKKHQKGKKDEDEGDDKKEASAVVATDDEKDEKEEDGKEASALNTLRTELDSIKSASDASAHGDVIAALEARLATLEKGAGDDEDEKEEEESKEASVEDRLAALTAGLDTLTVASDDEDDDKDDKDDDKDEKEEDKGEDKEASVAADATADALAAEVVATPLLDSGLEIELTPPAMDTLPEGDMLNDIFASAEAGKTASAPKRGVAKLGGVSKTASENGLGDLSKLWKSDPDVSGDFR